MMTSIKAFFRLLKHVSSVRLTVLSTLMVLAGLTDGFSVLLLVPLLESLELGGGQSDVAAMLKRGIGFMGLAPTLGLFLGAFLLLVALRSVIQFGRDQLCLRIQNEAIDGLRHRCFVALFAVEWRWLVTRRQSDHAALLLTNLSRVGIGLNAGLTLMVAIFSMGAYLFAACSLSLKMTLLALASGGAALTLLSGIRRRALELGHTMGASNRALHGNIQESLLGLKLAKILGNERSYRNRLEQTVAGVREQQIRFTRSTSLSQGLLQTGGAVLLVAYLMAGLKLWHTPLPELLILILVFSRLIPMFTTAQQQFLHWLNALPALLEAEALLEICGRHAEPEPVDDPNPLLLKGAMNLEGISVRYEGREHPALEGVSLRIPANTTTVVMGASGAGKSTLADLLMGLIAPDAGSVSVDGIALSGGERRRWRNSVVYVPQEVFLFNDTIRNNLRWGNPEAREVELRLALERAAADFVFMLPQGMDTTVGDGGVLLSGGERQRLALARALLRHPSLLILDESTSALDWENEARVRDAIEKLHGDMTIVFIGHRLPLSTLEKADQVLILENGRIKALGPWQDVKSVGPAPEQLTCDESDTDAPMLDVDGMKAWD